MVHEWYLWGESLQKSGFTGTTSKAGNPDSYSYTGDTITLRDFGQPYFIGGFVDGVTKSGGGRFFGSKSRAGIYHYVPSLHNDKPSDLMNRAPVPYQRKEVLTAETDSVNVNEVTLMGLLFDYAPPHRYPMNEQEILAMVPGKVKNLYAPQFSVTSAAAITSASGGTTLTAASQQDYWINQGSRYYILGAIPHLVNNSGFIQLYGNLPQDGMNVRHKDLIPLGLGAPPVAFRGTSTCLPYEPIGPFNMEAEPNIGLFSTAAAATTFSLLIAEI